MACIVLNLPKNAKFNFDDFFYLIKGYFSVFLSAGSLLTVFSAVRFQKIAIIGCTGILLTLGLVFILEKIAGSTVGSPAWVIMLFSLSVIFPVCSILCGISGIASILKIIQEYPSDKYILIFFAIFIFTGITLLIYLANRPPNINYMLESLSSHENQIKRLKTLHLLLEINDPRIIEPLIIILQNKNEPDYIRSAAAWGLGGNTIDIRSVKPLVQIVRDEKGCCRTDAVFALGKLASTIDTKPDGESFQALIYVLKDKDESLRAAAVQAISEIESHDVSGFLINALNDESEVVRFHAREGLMKIRN